MPGCRDVKKKWQRGKQFQNVSTFNVTFNLHNASEKNKIKNMK